MIDRRIMIMRHAKSDWEAGISTDHQRPLNARGRKDAPKIARHLKDLGWVPDIILCSDAVRTTQTYDLMRTVFEDTQVIFLTALYESTSGTIIDQIERIGAHYRSVMVIAHNPGVSELTERLTGQFTELTTANVLCLDGVLEDWAELSSAIRPNWKVKHWLQPRQLSD